MIDLLGHIGYAFLLGGHFLIARKNKWGFTARIVGGIIWALLGIPLEMYSIVIWSILFTILDIKGFYHWSKNENSISKS